MKNLMHIWAKKGSNWPKSALRVMRILRARACGRVRGPIFFSISSGSKFHEGLSEKSSRFVQLVPNNLYDRVWPEKNLMPKIRAWVAPPPPYLGNAREKTFFFRWWLPLSKLKQSCRITNNENEDLQNKKQERKEPWQGGWLSWQG